MTQEDKELLLKDLCARLPYGVKIMFSSNGFRWDWEQTLEEITKCDDGEYAINGWGIHGIRPYLRPMSSMTEEDNLSLSKYVGCSIRVKYGEIYFPIIEDNIPDKWEKVFDWLNRKMFDYRGLIPMGLALEVQSVMYNN